MSIEISAILDGIAEAGQKQITEIEGTADKQMAGIRSKTEAEASIQKNRILKDGHARLNRTCSLIEQQTIMHSLQLHADARQELIDKVIVGAEEKIATVRNEIKYNKILKTLMLDAIKALKPSLLDGQKIILHFDKRDEAISKDLMKDVEEIVIPRYDISCQGGCIAESEDGLVSTLNTFESRFQHSLAMIQQTLSVFFERKISTS
ncbi:MAG: V-type ATP synthase subunit E family protein [Pelolinea sp.]|nr:V-type ATP synthase subunit E family protein [Pelolinea sp.]